MKNTAMMCRRLSGLLLCGAALAGAATLQRAPYSQDVRPDRATVLWTTAGGAGSGSLHCTGAGRSLRADSTARLFPPEETGMEAPFHQHRATLTGLAPGTEYSCRVFLDESTEAAGGQVRFRTAGPGAFHFVVFGDSGDGGEAQRGLAIRMIRETPSLVVHTGDIAYPDGRFVQYEDHYFAIYAPLMRRVPFFTVPGNHDYGPDFAAPYKAVHAVPTDGIPEDGRGLYYSFDWDSVHFVMLDTNLPLNAAAEWGTGQMLRWLAEDLRKTRQPWRVAVLHHTPFPTGHHQDDTQCVLVRDRLLPLLEHQGIHLALSGHEHNYQRTMPHDGGRFSNTAPGTIYITTGGGGAIAHPPGESPDVVFSAGVPHYLRIDVDGPAMTVTATGSGGETLDRFSLSAAPALGAVPLRDAAAFGPQLAPGGLISIFGRNLARGDTTASGLPLPFELDGVEVSAGGVPLPLLHVSRGQINAQLPFDVAPDTTLRIRTPEGAADTPLAVRDSAPAVFLVTDGNTRVPAVTHAANARLVTADLPAAPGEWLSLYLTGLGRVRGNIAAGQPAPASPPMPTVEPARVEVNGMQAEVAFSGLAPGLAGVYQVNFRVPAGAAGARRMTVTCGTAASSGLNLYVR